MCYFLFGTETLIYQQPRCRHVGGGEENKFAVSTENVKGGGQVENKIQVF